MNFIKSLTQKKYFYLVFFFCLIVLFSFLLHIVIQHDRESGQPTDDLPRAQATIVNSPNAYTITENGQIRELYSNIRIHVDLSENESHEVNVTGQVDKAVAGNLDFGSVITVKYHENDHSTFYYANDPTPRHRVVLYVFFGVLIAASIAALIFSSKVLDVLRHRKVMQENMAKMQREKEQSQEDANRYRGADGTENFGDYTPFNDQGMDYNKLYEENQSLNDAAYNADGTYTGYTDTSADAPSGSYGMPNPSMDTSYDPNASYTGYGMPNPSMDASYDPTAPYTGYGMPNPSMDASYDPTAPYTGYGMPDPSMDAPYDPNAPYTDYGNPYPPNNGQGGTT